MTSKNSVVQTSNEVNQLISSTDGLIASYDNNGNMVSKTKDSITWTYAWSSENRLTNVSSTEGTNVSFEYDAVGRRNSKSSGGNTTEWIYDGDDILLEYQNSILTSRYTHGPSIDEPLAKTNITTGDKYYYHADGLGSITAITDSTGSIVERYAYSSFGQPTITNVDGDTIETSSINNFYSFTGRELDSETGLYYYRARYYDADLGKFISKDPIGFINGPNRYGYVGNNPINYVDPTGELVEILSRTVTKNTVHLLIRVYEIDKCGNEKTLYVYETSWNYPTDPPPLMVNEPGTLDNPNSTGNRYPIDPPPGMSQSQFEWNIMNEVANYNLPNYWFTGPNSNTFVDNVIEGAGGTMPADIPGALGQNYGDNQNFQLPGETYILW